ANWIATRRPAIRRHAMGRVRLDQSADLTLCVLLATGHEAGLAARGLAVAPLRLPPARPIVLRVAAVEGAIDRAGRATHVSAMIGRGTTIAGGVGSGACVGDRSSIVRIVGWVAFRGRNARKAKEQHAHE